MCLLSFINLHRQLLLAFNLQLLFIFNSFEHLFQLLPQIVLSSLWKHCIAFLEIHTECILYAIEVKPVKHSAYALNNCLLLANQLLIHRIIRLHEGLSRSYTIQLEKECFKEAEVIRPWEC